MIGSEAKWQSERGITLSSSIEHRQSAKKKKILLVSFDLFPFYLLGAFTSLSFYCRCPPVVSRPSLAYPPQPLPMLSPSPSSCSWPHSTCVEALLRHVLRVRTCLVEDYAFVLGYRLAIQVADCAGATSFLVAAIVFSRPEAIWPGAGAIAVGQRYDVGSQVWNLSPVSPLKLHSATDCNRRIYIQSSR